MTPGTKLGSYEILSAIGAGGMGEVYRARDPKLGRDVAIKVLPEAFARDADRMARFQREAKVLASLDHPNIASIYGLDESGGTPALVMQLVEGPTLADRIKQGPIPVDEAVQIARQITDALEYAHEHGIVHRDLKPANIKVAADDTVKILDFGLAKALEGDPASIDISTSPTISRMATMQGVLFGTAGYMSPEQAKAKPVDRRADIWAFGCVLFEMLTGKMAFSGETVTDTLASIIKEEPDWKLLPSATPMRVRVLLQRCLQKDPKQRLRDMGDARISLEEVLSGAQDPAASASEKLAAPGRLVRFKIQLPEKMALVASGVLGLSPDGRHLAFGATGSDGVLRLWVRSLDSLEARPLLGSESPNYPPFFWSPDSRYIAFDAGRCSASPLTILDPSRQEVRHVMPSFLSDERHFIYLRRSNMPDNTGVYVGSLDAKPEEQSSKLLVASQSGPAYVPPTNAEPGRLLFVRDEELMAQPFDSRRLEPSGEPVPVAGQVGAFLDQGFFSVSAAGTLVHRVSAPSMSQLTWFDQRGRRVGTVGEPVNILTLAVSPDGTRAVVSRMAPNPALWLIDLSRGTSTRFTFGTAVAAYAVWSPDGSRIIFASDVGGSYALYQKPASGVRDEELLLNPGEMNYPTSWSHDGRFLLCTSRNQKTATTQLWVLPLEGDRTPFLLLRTEFNHRDGQFSPDGRWVAYTSDETGRQEVYVRTFSPGASTSASDGGKWLISTAGGAEPRWSGDGKVLYYLAPDRKLMAVELSTSPAFLAGVPKAIFQAPPRTATLSYAWDMTPDGKRFLFPAPAQQTEASFTVVLNWQAALKK